VSPSVPAAVAPAEGTAASYQHPLAREPAKRPARRKNPVTSGGTPGTLTLVATPIGNLEDITLRALRVLREAHVIAAEDTRRTRKLLSRYQISSKLVSCHAHNEAKRTPALLEALRQGHDVALVSDAGTPGISDPGTRLAREAIQEGIPVTAAPGPSAVILSLCLSGLSADRYTFYGFLPKRNKERTALLEEASQVPHTMIFFEAPHRIDRALAWMLESFGDRNASLCRELTKRFEQIERGSLAGLLEKRSRGESETRGEFCIVVAGRGTRREEDEPREERLRKALEETRSTRGEPLREAARRAAARYGLSRREVYQAVLEEREKRKTDRRDP